MGARSKTSITIRLGEDLLESLHEQAKANGNSISAEIIRRLTLSSTDDTRLETFLREEIAELEFLRDGAMWERDEIRRTLQEGHVLLLKGEAISENVLAKMKYELRDVQSNVDEIERRIMRIKRVLGE